MHRALRDPTTYAIALDASPDGLTRGAWRAHRAGLGNAAFLVESVERLPSALAEIADEVTVHFPWGSLLRGLLDGSRDVLDGLARLLRPEGELRLLVSATSRDGYRATEPATFAGLAPHYDRCGLTLIEARWATPDEIAASRSSWAKRLGPRPAVSATYRGHSRSSSRRGRTSAGTAPSHGIHSTSKEPS